MAWRLLVRPAGRLTASFLPANANTCKSLVLASVLPQQNSFPLTCEGALLVFTATFSAVAPEEYAKRNYANNISEYNTVLGSLTAQRRNFLLRDVYDDMLLDGVQPIRDTFHALIVGAMKGARLQDALYFMDEMKSMGLMPDTTIYNFIISTCGKSKNSDCAIQVLEEMKRCGVRPRGQTYIALLCACASCGRVDRAYAIVRDMTAAGLGLNKYCYAGLITAFKNREPVTEETTSKIIELVKQSKGWSSVEASSGSGDSGMFGVTEEELYNIPTAEIVQRNYINRQLTVYHTALHACADLGSKEAVEAISEMLKQDGYAPDLFCVTQVMRQQLQLVRRFRYWKQLVFWCYLRCRDIKGAKQIFDDYISSGKPLALEFYTTLVQGAMIGYTPDGMETAQDTLQKLTARGWFPIGRIGSELLTAASGETFGGFTTANYIWDILQSRGFVPTLSAVEAYYKGLKERDIPENDPRLSQVTRVLKDLQRRFAPGRPM